MKQWQYCIMRVSHDKEEHQKHTVEVTYLGGGEDDSDINQEEISGFLEVIHNLGLAGWEMCGNFHYYQTANSGEIQLFYFKRPITPETPAM